MRFRIKPKLSTLLSQALGEKISFKTYPYPFRLTASTSTIERLEKEWDKEYLCVYPEVSLEIGPNDI